MRWLNLGIKGMRPNHFKREMKTSCRAQSQASSTRQNLSCGAQTLITSFKRSSAIIKLFLRCAAAQMIEQLFRVVFSTQHRSFRVQSLLQISTKRPSLRPFICSSWSHSQEKQTIKKRNQCYRVQTAIHNFLAFRSCKEKTMNHTIFLTTRKFCNHR